VVAVFLRGVRPSGFRSNAINDLLHNLRGLVRISRGYECDRIEHPVWAIQISDLTTAVTGEDLSAVPMLGLLTALNF
jgi:hypothetical protein